MKTKWVLCAVMCCFIGIAAMSLAGCHGHSKCAGCESAMSNGGWCDHCSKGFMDGKEMNCKGCCETMMGKKTGWCEGCKMGCVNGAPTACKGCVDQAMGKGACPSCSKK